MGMSWCPQDHSLLLSCSKDHRTICWDVSTTDIVCEMPTQDSWSFDVQVRASSSSSTLSSSGSSTSKSARSSTSSSGSSSVAKKHSSCCASAALCYAAALQHLS